MLAFNAKIFSRIKPFTTSFTSEVKSNFLNKVVQAIIPVITGKDWLEFLKIFACHVN